MRKRNLATATVLVAASLCTGSWAEAGGGLDKQLPSLDGLVRYGCAVKGPILQVDHRDPAGRMRPVWSVTFWAEHKSLFAAKPSKDWKLLYAFRKKRSKSLSDCDRFMERIRKARQEQPFGGGGQLAAQRDLRDVN